MSTSYAVSFLRLAVRRSTVANVSLNAVSCLPTRVRTLALLRSS